jgi:hypothetical protein
MMESKDDRDGVSLSRQTHRSLQRVVEELRAREALWASDGDERHERVAGLAERAGSSEGS